MLEILNSFHVQNCLIKSVFDISIGLAAKIGKEIDNNSNVHRLAS